MGVITMLHQHLPPASTIIFSIRHLHFIQFLCSEVMSVTLPKLSKLMSNENSLSNNYEMRSFMKPNVPAIMTQHHQSFTALESEQYAIEHEARF